ncbi:hypothetical protein HELRODRAFT_183780 [Helobdella robusta]|uniref:Antistasin-like domain-containing protein n=1 Tax=Helobdella robusta TaxID=6412 RepID=T1FK66_HELRO|nr:hypothetical protein HELRODRAFT_183780 [Helobdella robusta]ESO10313.1 hypothetical protein HELRODRAFT_183780 [Helobdella robusta]
MLMCANYNCPFGYEVDKFGCRTCFCNDPCEGFVCQENYRCQSVQVQCIMAPCNPVAECVYDCPLVKCSTQCSSGFQVDENGCNTCLCVDPCEVCRSDSNQPQCL